MRNAILLPLLLAACGSSSPAPEAAPAPAVEPAAPAAEPAAPAAADHLPPPFTADELRAGIAVGTELRLRVETAGQPTVIQHWVFTAVDEQGCTIAGRILDEAGGLVNDNGEGTSTWAELESHAHFPADRTTRSEARVTVAAGTYDAWKYEVRPAAPGEPVKVFYFARALPGPPVLMEVGSGDQVAMKMELVSRTQP